MSDIKHKVTEEQINVWLKNLLGRVNISVVTFRDGSNGLLNVPDKYVRVIDALYVALCNLAAGEALPEFTEPESPKGRRQARPARRKA